MIKVESRRLDRSLLQGIAFGFCISSFLFSALDTRLSSPAHLILDSPGFYLPSIRQVLGVIPPGRRNNTADQSKERRSVFRLQALAGNEQC